MEPDGAFLGQALRKIILCVLTEKSIFLIFSCFPSLIACLMGVITPKKRLKEIRVLIICKKNIGKILSFALKFVCDVQLKTCPERLHSPNDL